MPTLTQTQPAPTRYEAADLVRRVREAQADPVVDAFHALWYHAPFTWAMATFRDVPVLKAPTDLQVYHEILWATRPELVIETGTCYGGSALWFADQVSAWGGRVLSIDIQHPDAAAAQHPDRRFDQVRHDRVEFWTGSSTDPAMVDRVRAYRAAFGSVLVSLDSDHSHAHVTAELEAYADLVSPGSHLVVEDTNTSGRPLVCDDPGAGAAVDAWLPTRDDFAVSPLCERYLLTFHPGGWLYRVR